MSYKNFPFRNFSYFAAVVALYKCAKIHALSSSNKLSTEVAVLGLSRFFVFLSSQKFARLCQKLNKLGGPFFIFLDNFCCSIRILPNIPPEGHG